MLRCCTRYSASCFALVRHRSKARAHSLSQIRSLVAPDLRKKVAGDVVDVANVVHVISQAFLKPGFVLFAAFHVPVFVRLFAWFCFARWWFCCLFE